MERQSLMSERNINHLPLECTLTGDQAHNLSMCPDQNQTRDLLLCRTMPNQLSHTIQAAELIF